MSFLYRGLFSYLLRLFSTSSAELIGLGSMYCKRSRSACLCVGGPRYVYGLGRGALLGTQPILIINACYSSLREDLHSLVLEFRGSGRFR